MSASKAGKLRSGNLKSDKKLKIPGNGDWAIGGEENKSRDRD
jgi:hypothetical protein